MKLQIITARYALLMMTMGENSCLPGAKRWNLSRATPAMENTPKLPQTPAFTSLAYALIIDKQVFIKYTHH